MFQLCIFAEKPCRRRVVIRYHLVQSLHLCYPQWDVYFLSSIFKQQWKVFPFRLALFSWFPNVFLILFSFLLAHIYYFFHLSCFSVCLVMLFPWLKRQNSRSNHGNINNHSYFRINFYSVFLRSLEIGLKNFWFFIGYIILVC